MPLWLVVALLVVFVASRPVEARLWRAGRLSDRTTTVLMLGRMPALALVVCVAQGASSADRAARACIRNQASVVGIGSFAAFGLRFRSWSEVVFARELRERDLPFMALPAYHWHERVREPDFVVFVDGLPYAVEIHGEPYHPSGRTALDYERDLIYRLAGVEVVVLDASRVRRAPAEAVDLLLSVARFRRAS
jgi:hypothetical protein